MWEQSRERIDKHRLERVGKRLYKRRKETVERSFADAKQLHGHRYARMRGLVKVQQQCLLAATAQNIKKIALLLGRTAEKTLLSALHDGWRACLTALQQLTKLQPKPTAFA